MLIYRYETVDGVGIYCALRNGEIDYLDGRIIHLFNESTHPHPQIDFENGHSLEFRTILRKSFFGCSSRKKLNKWFSRATLHFAKMKIPSLRLSIYETDNVIESRSKKQLMFTSAQRCFDFVSQG